jgi:Na+/melibiose symporter-like transporter
VISAEDTLDKLPLDKQESDVIDDALTSRFDGLTKLNVWAYGVGHFINDLVAACWFNYLFFFLKRVVITPAASAAMLSGQICDGIATPIVGMLSDKFNTPIGQRKPWYIGGLILVFSCFIPLFSGFLGES